MFVLGTGAVSLAPTWFLLKLCVEKASRILLSAELLIAAMGPASWLAVRWMAAGPSPQSLPEDFSVVLGLLIAFGAIPRIVLGPVMLIIEGATILLIRERLTRTLLVAAMLLDLVPLSIFALDLAAATYR